MIPRHKFKDDLLNVNLIPFCLVLAKTHKVINSYQFNVVGSHDCKDVLVVFFLVFLAPQ